MHNKQQKRRLVHVEIVDHDQGVTPLRAEVLRNRRTCRCCHDTKPRLAAPTAHHDEVVCQLKEQLSEAETNLNERVQKLRERRQRQRQRKQQNRKASSTESPAPPPPPPGLDAPVAVPSELIPETAAAAE